MSKTYTRAEVIGFKQPVTVRVKNIRQVSKMIFGKFLRPNEFTDVSRSGMEWMAIPDIEGLLISSIDDVKQKMNVINPAVLKAERDARMIVGKKSMSQPADLPIPEQKEPPKATVIPPATPKFPLPEDVAKVNADKKDEEAKLKALADAEAAAKASKESESNSGKDVDQNDSKNSAKDASKFRIQEPGNKSKSGKKRGPKPKVEVNADNK